MAVTGARALPPTATAADAEVRGSAEEEFRAFMTVRWTRLLRTAYFLTGNHHDAEDLVQTALAKAFARWQRVRQADDPDAYVWRMLINANVDRMRRFRIPEWLTNRFPERHAPDASDQLGVRDALLAALARLSALQRAVVVLRYLEDRSEAEVAALLGKRVGTVRTHNARALRRLRGDDALRESGGEEERTG
ncbi:SigE family RNA polymerase sigma factor [Streptomyces johnsoniae]|uniref:SigE family RNA polymerase sigma factor n=1 Tax=Streptomyces johnsoniae TaxID=3075532 RepID=A0ABU2S9H2_9ACTN|nr:SigE family RNA polymerase sigma factor [Streptomyces sp. DSM 41886]MDT0445600.1 SigE family RNA polymerase sigma factor [Streptomyces sp. DSM 41886]